MSEELNPKDLESAMGAEEVTGEEAEMSPDALDLSLSSKDATSEQRQASVTGQLASVRGGTLDLTAIAQAEFDIDPEASLEIEADQVYMNMEEQLAGAATDAINSGMNPNDLADKLTAGDKVINDLRMSPISKEWAVLKQAADSPLDPDLHREIALQFAMAGTLTKLKDEMSGGDYAADIVGIVIPFRETAAWEQLKGGIKGQPLLSNFMQGNDIEGMVNSWQSLEVDKKEILFPVLINTIVESMGFTVPVPFTSGVRMRGNELQALTMIMRFFQPDGGARASQEQKAFAALDFLDVGLSAGAAAIKLQKTMKIAKAANAKFAPTEPAPGFVDPSVESATARFRQIDVQAEAKAAGRAARKQAQKDGLTKKQARDIGKAARKDERAKLFAELNPETKNIMAGIMVNAARYSARVNTIPKLLAKAGAKGKAADINIGAMTTPEVARAYGIRSDDAIENAMPFQTKEWMPQVIEGLVPETAARINAFMMKAEGKVRSVTTESELFRAGILDEPERQAATMNFIQEMERIGEDMLLEGITLSDVKVLDTKVDAFNFEYTITRGLDAAAETFTGRRSWRIQEATGNYMETATDLVKTTSASIPGQSPAAWSMTKEGILKDFNDTFKEAHVLQDINVANATRISDFMRHANDSISGIGGARARGRVDAVELAGDAYVNPDSAERGKVFSPRELAAGIKIQAKNAGDETIVYLTDPREVEAYYKRRIVSDSFQGIQDYVTRRELEVGGFKRIDVLVGEKQMPLIAKPFDTVDAARASVRNKQGFEAYNGATGKVEVLDAEMIAERYDSGMVLTRLQEDWNVTGNMQMLGGKHVEYVFTSKLGIQTLPNQVTHYKAGYVPKISEGVEYVVQQKFGYKKAGATDGVKTKAMRAFASKRDAIKFQTMMATKLAAKKKITLDEALLQFDIGDGSVMGQVERMQNNMSGSGGLFTGTRSQDDLLMGLDGVDIERMSPGEAFGRYVDHLGTQVSKNEWRMAKEQQWINTARELMPEARVTGFSIKNIDSSSEKGKALIRLFNQVQQWNRVPSRKESLYQAQVQFLNDWMLVGLNKLPGVSRQAIPNFMNLKHKNATNAAMSASMHLMLGTMNLAQLFVQSVTSVVAISLRPIKEGPGILRDAGKMTYLDNIRDETALANHFKKMARATDEDVKLTASDWDMYQAWLRGGQRESVRSNADMNYMASTGLGMGADFARKAGNMSLYLYRSGELVNRRVSFAAAWRWGLENFPKLDRKGDELLEHVLKRSNLTMLELNAANKAWWQGGQAASASQKITQMASQFLQVAAKTAELTVKGPKRGGFTGAERRRIVMGQAIMFGSSGVPPLAWFGPTFLTMVSDQMGLDPDNAEDMETIKSIANAYNQGTIGIIAREGFGADIKLANRVAIGANIAETAWDILASDDPMALKMLGVSGVVGERLNTAWKESWSNIDLLASQTLLAMAHLEPYAFADRSGQEQLTGGEIMAVVHSLGTTMLSIPSSTRSFMKAYIMRNHDVILSKKGQINIAKDFATGTEIGVAWGFQTNDEARLNILTMDRKDQEDIVRAVSDIIVKEYHNLKFLYNEDPDHASMLRKKVMFLQERMGSPWMVEKLRQSLKSRLKDNPQSKEEREMADYFSRYMHNELTNATMVDQGIVPKQITLPFGDLNKEDTE